MVQEVTCSNPGRAHDILFQLLQNPIVVCTAEDIGLTAVPLFFKKIFSLRSQQMCTKLRLKSLKKAAKNY